VTPTAEHTGGRRTPWTDHPRVVALRQRWVVVDVVVGTLAGYRRHRTARNAAVVSYYGFISAFPLYLVFITVLGIVLRDRPEWEEDIIDSTLINLPIVGGQLQTDPMSLGGSHWVALVGLVTAIWAGMKAFVAIHAGIDDTAEIDIDERVNAAVVRGHALVAIAIIGVGLVTTSVLTTIVATDLLRGHHEAIAIVVSAIVNMGIVAFTYKFLCSQRRTLREVWAGALWSGLAFAVLQVLSSTIIGRAIVNASPVYGSFATVIALLAWMSLHAHAAFFGDELNRELGQRDRSSRTTS